MNGNFLPREQKEYVVEDDDSCGAIACTRERDGMPPDHERKPFALLPTVC